VQHLYKNWSMSVKRSLLSVERSLLSVERSLLSVDRSLLSVDRSLLNMNRRVLSGALATFTCRNVDTRFISCSSLACRACQ